MLFNFSSLFFPTLLLSSLLLCADLAQAQTPTPTLLELAESNGWKKLLHYTTDGQSSIQSKAFFLAADGNSNPLAELQATYQALIKQHIIAGQQAQCRFPGRYRWLRQQLQWTNQQVPELPCAEFAAFSAQGNAQSLSLIFATGFLGNPASYYGHLLLKVNGADRLNNNSDLTATAVNFGADVPVDENMLLYISKGIVGGYDSSFSQLQYFYHAHNYGEAELRDLWEFELDLPKPTLDLMLGHLWEVMAADFTYYFFNRNCAYRIAEVLELVIDEPLTQRWRGWETPQAVVQRIAGVKLKQQKLVSTVRFYPSRQSRLYQRYQQLSATEQRQLQQLVAQPEHLQALLTPMSATAQYALLDTLMDYYQLLKDDKAGFADDNHRYYLQVLSQRYALPPGGQQPVFQSANRPDQGRKPSYLNLGWYQQQDGLQGMNIWLRPAYYDALDAGYGHTRHSALAMGELQLGLNREKLFIRDLSLVKIESVRNNLTGLPGDQHYSWYLDVGARQQQLLCQDCLALKARAGMGYAKSDLSEQFTGALYAGAGFLSSALHRDGFYVSTTATLNWYANEWLTLRAAAEQRWRQAQTTQHLFRLDARWALATDLDLRLTWQKDQHHEFSFSAGWYW